MNNVIEKLIEKQINRLEKLYNDIYNLQEKINILSLLNKLYKKIDKHTIEFTEGEKL